MSKSVEFEERVMLTEKQYFEIASFYINKRNNHPFIVQTNYYFDTPDFLLRSKHILFRLRVVKHKYSELTLKIKGNNGDIEINQKLSYIEAHNFLNKLNVPYGPLYDYFKENGLPISCYKQYGNLTTKRLEIKEDDYLVVIDKNDFLSTTDYDLEIESGSMERSKEVILKICEKFSVEYKNDYTSKSSRLFKKLFS